MADKYEEILAGTVALGYLDCTLLEYAQGIKYYIDQEARKPNCDTHLVNMLRRAACVGWENINLFHASPIEVRSAADTEEMHALKEAHKSVMAFFPALLTLAMEAPLTGRREAVVARAREAYLSAHKLTAKES